MTKFSFPKKFIYLVLPAAILFDSCSKTNVSSIPGVIGSGSVQLHGMGLNPMTPDQYANIPVFSPELFGARPEGLSVSGALPSSYLLTTPGIRDQGQTGACTSFAGSEADEIINYYKDVPSAPTPSITVANAISTVLANKFVDPTSYFGVDGELAPNFIYYVERCVIEGYKITQDPGATMVDIGETLQGLSNNTGTGKALTLSGVTYKGQCTEDLYPYPWVDGTGSSAGYNVATIKAAGFKTPPSSSAVSDAVNFTLGAQSGSTTPTGTTTAHGYYTIPGTGDTVEVNYCKTAIANNKPVMMGFEIYDNSSYTIFEGLSTTSYIYNQLVAKTTKGVTTYVLNTKLTLLGGHANVLVGYVNDGTASTSATGGGYFVVQNSWGIPWGNNGYYLMPYSVLRNSSIVGSGNLYVAIL